jgi:(S)-2-hydroxyglutarate dehydrogenase
VPARVDVAVVGAGLVGLAAARQLVSRHPDLRVAVLDKEPAVARHQSGHNSGVVHAGLYYAPGSLKARLCREGASLLREFCAAADIPLVTRGKLVVAAEEWELPRLAELRRRGEENGIGGIRELSPSELREVEPHVVGVRALHVPESGVVDYRLVATRLADELAAAGATVQLGAEVVSARRNGGGLTIETRTESLHARALVVCAGLQSDRMAALLGLDSAVRVVPFRGDYWRLRGRAASFVRGLVYPVPDPSFPFLGVHFTRAIDEVVSVGPNAVPSLARERYSRFGISPRDARDTLMWPGLFRLARRYAKTGALEIWRDVSKRAAVAEMRRYVPELEAADVVRAGCGIRAQVMTRAGELVDDFLVEEGPASLHVLNAPSPAATSCLAIGRLIAERAEERFELR